MLSDSHRQALWTVLAAEFETGGKLHERVWVFLPGIRVFDSVQVRVLMLTNEHLRLSLAYLHRQTSTIKADIFSLRCDGLQR